MSGAVLEVSGLCKRYPGFYLDHVGFTLGQGRVMGLVGRNGAGKSTTLNSLLDFVHPQEGVVRFFGNPLSKEKEKIGFVSGGVDYYPRKKLRTITQVTKRFYSEWDDAAYQSYLRLFALDERKTPSELSAGMKVKYSLALALSHRATLLLLDEPTSGLDPVSRQELLDIFLELSREKGVSILFSTHITSDLEKCADDITYIQNGTVPYTGEIKAFLGQYRLIRHSGEGRPEAPEALIGLKREKESWAALLPAGLPIPAGWENFPADLDTIMVHLEYHDHTEEAVE